MEKAQSLIRGYDIIKQISPGKNCQIYLVQDTTKQKKFNFNSLIDCAMSCPQNIFNCKKNYANCVEIKSTMYLKLKYSGT